ncbi:hypothetical protein IWX88_000292 [Frigoribacterium sp. CG_9.8]|nr:hypothetical protein [Frigoribacterium sp. CG_9.8]
MTGYSLHRPDRQADLSQASHIARPDGILTRVPHTQQRADSIVLLAANAVHGWFHDLNNSDGEKCRFEEMGSATKASSEAPISDNPDNRE